MTSEIKDVQLENGVSSSEIVGWPKIEGGLFQQVVIVPEDHSGLPSQVPTICRRLGESPGNTKVKQFRPLVKAMEPVINDTELVGSLLVQAAQQVLDDSPVNMKLQDMTEAQQAAVATVTDMALSVLSNKPDVAGVELRDIDEARQQIAGYRDKLGLRIRQMKLPLAVKTTQNVGMENVMGDESPVTMSGVTEVGSSFLDGESILSSNWSAVLMMGFMAPQIGLTARQIVIDQFIAANPAHSEVIEAAQMEATEREEKWREMGWLAGEKPAGWAEKAIDWLYSDGPQDGLGQEVPAEGDEINQAGDDGSGTTVAWGVTVDSSGEVIVNRQGSPNNTEMNAIDTLPGNGDLLMNDLASEEAQQTTPTPEPPETDGVNFLSAVEAGLDISDPEALQEILNANERVGLTQVAIHTGRYAEWFGAETQDNGTFTFEEETEYLRNLEEELSIQVIHSQTADGLISSFPQYEDPQIHDMKMLWAVNNDNLLMGERPDVPGTLDAYHFAEVSVPAGFSFMAVDHIVFVIDESSGVPVAWVDPSAGQGDGEGKIVNAMRLINPDGTANSQKVTREGADLVLLGDDGAVVSRINAESDGWRVVEAVVQPDMEVVDYGICQPENFKECSVPWEDLFNGKFLAFLETLSKPFDVENMKSVPMKIIGEALHYSVDNLPNFPNMTTIGLESEADFRRGITAGITEFEGNNYIIFPIEYYNPSNPEKNVWVIGLYPLFEPDKGYDYRSNSEVLNWIFETWRNRTQYNPIMVSNTMRYYNTPDLLVSQTFNEDPEMQSKFSRFIADDRTALHGKVLLIGIYRDTEGWYK